ncbi:formate dehydrogenase accessory sulfurtransferase FdhD [Opitutus terrae]|uniref:formate dehydrogenase accessory sulfurtransferase FdhD n=1 Tax=Opitutus terrae TaxID=107709 RepID=UPI0002E4B4D8|nr:formate dehydrogenase accessory sulfurtransferase FdhD [Opitutus terrae]
MSSDLCCTETDETRAVRAAPSLRWSQRRGWSSAAETLAVEAPLALEIAYARGEQDVRKVLAITMRTPGHDAELAAGFLLAEGLITTGGDIVTSTGMPVNARGERVATQQVRLRAAPREDLQRLSRGLLTSSACGVCGRPSLEGLPLARVAQDRDGATWSCATLAELPERLRREQTHFSVTGGSHAAALWTRDAGLLVVREDVGRHNAVDKVLGAALLRNVICTGAALVLSGRASFELVQKAAASGVPVVLAVGAPSSLAASLAHAAGITLIGFARDARFNVYTHADRLAMAG